MCVCGCEWYTRVLCVDGLSAGGRTLDGLHGGGVEGLLGQGPLLVPAARLRALHLLLPLGLVQVVHAQQQAVVHDLKAF